MKTSTDKLNAKLQKIADKAKPYVYSRLHSLEWWQIMEHSKMINYRRQFEKESERIGYIYTFGDCLC
jgi:hypothetical protein